MTRSIIRECKLNHNATKIGCYTGQNNSPLSGGLKSSSSNAAVCSKVAAAAAAAVAAVTQVSVGGSLDRRSLSAAGMRK